MTRDDDPSFGAELFAFLRELAGHNERPWFQANKGRYERDVREPTLAFVEDMAHRLPAVAPHLVADKRSVFRIHRDIRFARDKSPYKTHAGVFFRHRDAGEAETPGLYLHLEPRRVFLGAGAWQPGSAALKRIRTAIVTQPDKWRAAVADVAPEWALADGQALKRAPAGFPADHPQIEYLRRKNFAVVSRLSQREATRRGFLDEVTRRAGTARPYMAFLCDALGVAY